jgi:hypothetical protein
MPGRPEHPTHLGPPSGGRRSFRLCGRKGFRPRLARRGLTALRALSGKTLQIPSRAAGRAGFSATPGSPHPGSGREYARRRTATGPGPGAGKSKLDRQTRPVPDPGAGEGNLSRPTRPVPEPRPHPANQADGHPGHPTPWAGESNQADGHHGHPTPRPARATSADRPDGHRTPGIGGKPTDATGPGAPGPARAT